jgi:16S rRNA (guanine527-N7)-methyltransferase
MSEAVVSVPSAEAIHHALREFRVGLNDTQVQQIQQYMKMLAVWNDKINLTAIRDPIEVLHRHFAESMFGAVMVPVQSGRLADIGSGGGFPGLPLKILRPDLQLFLVESNVKKATFLAEVVRNLQLTGVQVLVSRYEELDEELAPLDFVCARAIGEFEAFLSWAAVPRVAAKQIVLWAGGRDLAEIRRSDQWDWREPIAIPQSLQRFLIAGTRKGVT